MNSYVLTGLSFLSAEGKRDLVDAMLNIQVMRRQDDASKSSTR